LGARWLAEKRRRENFPVALRLLPVAVRTDLAVVYEVARTIDELGDSVPGDRVAQLQEFSQDMATIWSGEAPERPVLRRLAATVLRRDLDELPFQCLIQANLLDQQVSTYRSYEQLREYCALSAEPVGRIVLQVFGVSNPATRVLAGRVCAALQIIEHCQDVGEDRRAGRVYLPIEDFQHYGVPLGALDARSASPGVRRLIEFQLARAEALLDSGAALVRLLSGWPRWAVAGFVAGGRAAADDLRRGGFDVLAHRPQVRRRDQIGHAVRLLAGRGRR
jgi:squalene synthase HpnC